jgi:hypothetical protein
MNPTNVIFVVEKMVSPKYKWWVKVMVFNTTFNNISVILMKETGVPREKHRPAASYWQTLSHNVVSSTLRLNEIQTYNVSGD